ncbi:MAG TPA: DMT family transporter [Patescibacteria group bacterium]|nr:DMT family transporter [Patescibacteria group bacterium]
MSIASWLLPSLVALFIWGLTAFLPKLLLRNMRPLHMIVYNCFFFFLTACAVQLVFLNDWQFESRGALLAMATGACGTLGQVCYLQALQRGPLTYVSMISSLYPAVATMLAFILLPDPLTLRQGLGVVLGLASIMTLVLASDNPGKPTQPKPVNDQ